jgi:hypothetical protein
MAWPLHLAKKAKLQLTNEAIEGILRSRDCVACTLLFELHQADDRIIELAKELLDSGHHERDQQWLLLYHLYFHDAIPRADDEECFQVLRDNNVNFIPQGEEKTDAELYCEYVDNPFREDEEVVQSYPDWKAEKRRAAPPTPQARPDPLAT